MKDKVKSSIFYLSILIMGINPVFYHVLILRELIGNFFENELIIAIFLSLWLVMEAIGSGLLSRALIRKGDPVRLYSIFLTLNAVLGPLCLFLSRIIRNLLLMEFGEVPNLFVILMGTTLTLFPLAVIDGCMFPAGYRMGHSLRKGSSKAVGYVYAVESLGSVLGGIMITLFILSHLSPFKMVLIISFINIIIALFLPFILNGALKRPGLRSFIISIFGLIIVLFYMSNSSWLEETSTLLRWKGYHVLEYKNSLYHNIVLADKEAQMSLFVDGRAIISLPHPDVVSIEEFGHIPLLYVKNPRRILLIGEGFGGLINEFLKYPDLFIDYLRIDREIIKTVLEVKNPVIEKEIFNRRVNVVFKDPISHVKDMGAVYDAILVAGEFPSTFLSGRYFTREFFEDVKAILSKGGILAIETIGGESYVIDELRMMISTIYNTMGESFRYRGFVPGEKLVLLASQDIDIPAFNPLNIISTFKERELETRYLSPYSLRVKYNPTKVDLFRGIFQEKAGRINSINKPIVVHQAMSYESSIYAPGWGKFLSLLGRIPKGMFFVIFLVPLILLLLLSRFRSGIRNMIIPLTIGLTGLAGMVGSMAITIFFQALFGGLYLKMGLVFASFMSGIFMASIIISRKLARGSFTRKFILSIELIIFLYFLALIPIFYQLPVIPVEGTVLKSLEISLYFLNFLLGCLVGIEFPVANIIMEREGYIKESGGVLYAYDLIGAFIGSIIVVTLILPVMGFMLTLLLIALIKLVNIFIILLK